MYSDSARLHAFDFRRQGADACQLRPGKRLVHIRNDRVMAYFVYCFLKTVIRIPSHDVITFRVSRRRREMYSGHDRLCVCLSLAAFPHYCTDPDVTWGNGRDVPSNCALLGGFAIGARVSFPWQHSAESEMSASACTRSMPGFCLCRVAQKRAVGHYQ